MLLNIILNENNTHNNAEPAQKMNNTELNKQFCGSFFQKLQDLENRGVKVVIYPPSYMQSCYIQNEDAINDIRNIFEKANQTPICDWSECAYDDSLFYDTRYHLNREGAMENTLQLIRLLKLKL